MIELGVRVMSVSVFGDASFVLYGFVVHAVEDGWWGFSPSWGSCLALSFVSHALSCVCCDENACVV